MSTAYITGPVSKIPNANRDQFEQAKAQLSQKFDEVIVPIDHPLSQDAFQESQELGADYAEGKIYQQLMREHFGAVLRSDRLYALYGWHHATGACREIMLAFWAGIPVYHLLNNKPFLWVHYELACLRCAPK